MTVEVTKGRKVPGGGCTFGGLALLAGWCGERGVCLAAGMLGAQGYSSAPVQTGSHLQ